MTQLTRNLNYIRLAFTTRDPAKLKILLEALQAGQRRLNHD